MFVGTKKQAVWVTRMDSRRYRLLKRIVKTLKGFGNLRNSFLFLFAIIVFALRRQYIAEVAALRSQLCSLREIHFHAWRICLTGSLLETPSLIPYKHESNKEIIEQDYVASLRKDGRDWPLFGLTMIGEERMKNIDYVIQESVRLGVDGDFVECGVWRGGASMYARAVLNAFGETERLVYLFDSFNGLPQNTSDNDGDFWSKMSYISVPLDEVQRHFDVSGLNGKNVIMIPGYFRYSLPAWCLRTDRTVAILRMDGDMFESTMDILFNLWDLVSRGGYIIVDDYHSVPAAKNALNKFFDLQGIKPELMPIDQDGIYFIKNDYGRIKKSAMEWYLDFNSSRNINDMSA